MLVLTRQQDQDIVIGDGDSQIVLTVVAIRGDKVRLGVTAPPAVPVHRREVFEAIKRERAREQNLPSLGSGPCAGGPGPGT